MYNLENKCVTWGKLCKLENKCVNWKKKRLTWGNMCILNSTKLTTTIFLFEMKIIRLQLDYVD